MKKSLKFKGTSAWKPKKLIIFSKMIFFFTCSLFFCIGPTGVNDASIEKFSHELQHDSYPQNMISISKRWKRHEKLKMHELAVHEMTNNGLGWVPDGDFLFSFIIL